MKRLGLFAVIAFVMVAMSGCFQTTLVECKKPVDVGGKTFCEK